MNKSHCFQKKFFTISVVIITYNRSRALKECFASLSEQDYPKELYEIIVIDDGSIDETEEFMKMVSSKGHIRYLKQAHKGCGSARNRGIEMASNEIITFVADDYIFRKDWLLSINDFFQKNDRALAMRSVIRNKNKNFASLIDEFYNDVSMKIKLFLSDNRSSIIKGIFYNRDEWSGKSSFYLTASGCAAYRASVFSMV